MKNHLESPWCWQWRITTVIFLVFIQVDTVNTQILESPRWFKVILSPSTLKFKVKMSWFAPPPLRWKWRGRNAVIWHLQHPNSNMKWDNFVCPLRWKWRGCNAVIRRLQPRANCTFLPAVSCLRSPPRKRWSKPYKLNPQPKPCCVYIILYVYVCVYIFVWMFV